MVPRVAFNKVVVGPEKSGWFGMLNIDGLLSPNTPQSDRDFWNSARLVESHLNERDGTGFPQVAGLGVKDIVSGTGKNKITTTDARLFVLTPE